MATRPRLAVDGRALSLGLPTRGERYIHHPLHPHFVYHFMYHFTFYLSFHLSFHISSIINSHNGPTCQPWLRWDGTGS